jgi:hypothetical protein
MSPSPANSFFLEYRPADSIDAVYALEVECLGGGPEAEDFRKIIEVPSDLSLVKLHLLMQHVIGTDEGKIDAFYLAASLRGVKTWYKRNSAWVLENQAALNFSVREVLPPQSNRKLFYLRGSRMFRVSKVSAGDTPLPDRKYPRIVQRQGMTSLY